MALRKDGGVGLFAASKLLGQEGDESKEAESLQNRTTPSRARSFASVSAVRAAKTFVGREVALICANVEICKLSGQRCHE